MLKNMAGMMKQAQEMQKNMKLMQEKLAEMELEGQAGGGMVKVTMTGKNEVRRVEINPEVVDKDDVETLEDLVAAAVNDAVKNVQDVASEEMKKVTGGMNIPGLM